MIWCIQNDDCHLRLRKTKKLLPLNAALKIQPKQTILLSTHILQVTESSLEKVQERQVHHIEHDLR